ncbi:metallophosphoesterase [Phycisphaeraceae bacterium D3-23]
MQYSAIVAAVLSSSVLCHTASAQQPWTLVGVGDTQVQVQTLAGGQVFRNNMQWVADHYADHNIAFVTQVGDIVQDGGYGAPNTPAPTLNNLQQWQRADAAMSILDATPVGWGTAVGNHELDWVDVRPGLVPSSNWWAGANPGMSTPASGFEVWKSYFGPETTGRFDGMSQFGGAAPNDLDSYYLYDGGGRQYLHLHLQLDVPDESLAWAQSVIDANPGVATIITTHVFEGTSFGPPNNPYLSGPGRNSANEVWDQLITENDQIFMVLSGHTGQAIDQTRINDTGNEVFTIVQDYAGYDRSGTIEGYIRLYEFDEANGVIHVQTYSPTLDTYLTGPSHEFDLPLDFADRFGPIPEPATGALLLTGLVLAHRRRAWRGAN